jgi:prepilin-type N-terminal cleavage/methylation domain-containing protein
VKLYSLRRDERGLTAIELLVTIVIVLLIASFAMLRQQPIVSTATAQAAARQVMTDLRLARSKAIQHNTAFRVTFATDGASYIVERLLPGTTPTWQNWGLYTHSNAVLVSPQPISLPPNVRVANNYQVRFLPRGSAQVDSTDQRVLLSATGNVRWAVQVTAAGAVQITAP